MKIIRRGIDPALISLRASCDRCKTEIEFLPHEAKYTSCQREGDFYQIACPVCSKMITKNAGSAKPNYYTDH